MTRSIPIFLSLVLLIAPAALGDKVTLDLRGCYERALEQIESIGIAAAELRAAEARYRQGRDSLVPEISLNAQEELQNRREEDEPDQFEARLSAEQVLYSGFRITRAYEALGKDRDALRFDEKRLRELLYLDVSDVYHQILFYQKDEAILQELAAALDETVAELDKRTSLGRSRKADLLKAQADRAETLVELETTRGQLHLARELMAYLLNLPAEDFDLLEQSPFPADPVVEEKLAVVAARADIQAGLARVEASRKRVEAARGERQPEVAAGADLYLLESPDQDHEWNVLLTFALPLFDEGVIKAKVAESTERVRISELNLASVRRSAESEVRSAYIAFMAALAQRERLKEAIATSRENYEVQKRDYELGRSSQLDALNALAQVHRLRRRDAAAGLRANDSLVRLHVAAGEVGP